MLAAGSGRIKIVKRYEKKYLVPLELLPAIREYIAPFTGPDKYGEGVLPEYFITTMQLDTPDLAFHYAKEDELDYRFKLRVRTYGEIGSSPVFAEVKGKLHGLIVKTRAVIPFDKWSEELVFSTDLPDIFLNHKQENDFLKFRRLVWETAAQPSNIIRYIRESYVGTGKHYLRVTMDRQLEYCAKATWAGFGVGESWYSMDSSIDQARDDSCIVLEIKTLMEVPVWVIDMVEHFDLQQGGNCKYSTGIWKEALFSRTAYLRDYMDDFLVWSI